MRGTLQPSHSAPGARQSAPMDPVPRTEPPVLARAVGGVAPASRQKRKSQLLGLDRRQRQICPFCMAELIVATAATAAQIRRICAPAVRVLTTLGDQPRAVGEVHQPQRVPATPHVVASWGRWFGLCPAQGSLPYSLGSPCWELRRL